MENYVQYSFRTATNVTKKQTKRGSGDFKEIEDTEKPEVKHTPKFKRKENLEDKLMEFIDLTAKQDASLALPMPVEKPKDYVAMQIEAMGEAIRCNLSQKAQFECLHEMQSVLFRYMNQNNFNMNMVQQQQAAPPPQAQVQQGNFFTGGEYRDIQYQNL